MCRVLIIEDEPMVALLLEDIAFEGGATDVGFATTEAAAVASARAVPPDIILSDVRLAVGSGPAAVSEIRHFTDPAAVIFITASPDECRPRAPLDRVIPKPFARGGVLAAVQEVVARVHAA